MSFFNLTSKLTLSVNYTCAQGEEDVKVSWVPHHEVAGIASWYSGWKSVPKVAPIFPSTFSGDGEVGCSWSYDS